MSTLTEVYRTGLQEGRLPIMACGACGAIVMYPRHRCPACHAAELGWRDAAGDGVLHSFTVVRAVPPAGFEDQLPYALGVVKLAEGAQLLGRLVPEDGDWAGYACDAPVRFDPAATIASAAPEVPWFRLERAG
jgi:uncharacterized OB-fold protein